MDQSIRMSKIDKSEEDGWDNNNDSQITYFNVVAQGSQQLQIADKSLVINTTNVLENDEDGRNSDIHTKNTQSFNTTQNAGNSRVDTNLFYQVNEIPVQGTSEFKPKRNPVTDAEKEETYSFE